jgi:acetyl esterase/lipase
MSKTLVRIAMSATLWAGATTGLAAQDLPAMAPVPPVQDDGTIRTPSFDLPFSSLASPEARRAFVERLRSPAPLSTDIATARRNSDEKLRPQYELIARMYPMTATRSKVGNIPIETFVPVAGVAPQNRNRVLIQLHGGGFTAGGGGMTGALESIPIAGTMRIKVVAVDYRLAPENRFPAASEDVATVYRELLKAYPAKNIGIYGCSAGGMLSGEAVAWFLKEKLPVPGAIGIFCASTHTFAEGDSAQLWTRMGSVLRILPPAHPDGTFGRTMAYFAGVRADNPLAVPSASRDVLKAFPPTLFMTGTRAPEASAAAQSHLELRDLGVKSELLLFDGMDHGFYSDATLPESQRAYRLIARFFDENLGK